MSSAHVLWMHVPHPQNAYVFCTCSVDACASSKMLMSSAHVLWMHVPHPQNAYVFCTCSGMHVPHPKCLCLLHMFCGCMCLIQNAYVFCTCSVDACASSKMLMSSAHVLWMHVPHPNACASSPKCLCLLHMFCGCMCLIQNAYVFCTCSVDACASSKMLMSCVKSNLLASQVQ